MLEAIEDRCQRAPRIHRCRLIFVHGLQPFSEETGEMDTPVALVASGLGVAILREGVEPIGISLIQALNN